MVRSWALAVAMTIGMMACVTPIYATTHYVEQDQSSVNATLDVSFSASGYLKLVIFDPNGWLDFLNPRADAMAGIYANTSLPPSVTGTLDAAVAGDQLTLSAMDLNLLADGPRSFQAGADVHVDEIPFLAEILGGIIENYLDWIDPNVFDPNVITDLLQLFTGGFDFDYDFQAAVNALTLVQTGDPGSATLEGGAFSGLWVLADVDSEIQFNGGDPIDVPTVPLPFSLSGTHTSVPVSTLTLGGEPASGGIETPEVVIIDRLIVLPIGESGIDVTFQIHLQIDAGHANYIVGPQITALSGYLLTTEVDPPGMGSVATVPAGPEYPPGT